MKILFVDAKESRNYDFEFTKTNSLGGTESSLLQVARELAKDHEVYVAQLNRTQVYKEYDMTYVHVDQGPLLEGPAPDIVIILRKYRLLPTYRKAYPNARLFVWVTNFQPYEILGRRHLVVRSKATVICLSRNHQQHIDKIFNGIWSWIFRLLALRFARIPITYIYYFVDQDFVETESPPYRKEKLFFFSTANKGLDQVLESFKAVLQRDPSFKLYIANNTRELLREYKLDQHLLDSDSVVILGKIPKAEIIRNLRDSLCVFYPQNRHPETFGLIYTEANCVGTPVLAHPFGSAEEVLENPDQLVDAEDTQAIVEKILKWRDQGRPKVGCPKKLARQAIMKQWKETLGIPS